jgi:hypothetical protein
MKYDQVDAFFAGLFAGPMRVLLGLVTMCLPLAVCLIITDEFESISGVFFWALFALLPGIVFYWADYGMWAILGVLLFVAQWGALYAFIVSEDCKIWWFILFSASTACSFPFALEGPWWIIICGYIILSAVYWLPDVIAKIKS